MYLLHYESSKPRAVIPIFSCRIWSTVNACRSGIPGIVLFLGEKICSSTLGQHQLSSVCGVPDSLCTVLCAIEMPKTVIMTHGFIVGSPCLKKSQYCPW